VIPGLRVFGDLYYDVYVVMRRSSLFVHLVNLTGLSIWRDTPDVNMIQSTNRGL
jgi:hypothetical protein